MVIYGRWHLHQTGRGSWAVIQKGLSRFGVSGTRSTNVACLTSRPMVSSPHLALTPFLKFVLTVPVLQTKDSDRTPMICAPS